MREVPICLLTEAFADMRRNAGRSLTELIPQRRISSKTGPAEDGRNCVRRFERRLKDFEIFKGFGEHK